VVLRGWPARLGGLQQPVGDAGQADVGTDGVEGEQVALRRGREEHAQVRVVQQHRLLHERHDVPRVGDAVAALPGVREQLVAEPAGEPLRLPRASFSGLSSARWPSRSHC
jgi:hypothetical protein